MGVNSLPKTVTRLLTSTLPVPSASEVTTLWRYTNLFIIIIIFFTLGTYLPEGV